MAKSSATIGELLTVAAYFYQRQHSVMEAAAELGVDTATVTECLDALADAEVPGQTSIPAFDVVRPNRFTAEITRSRVEPLGLPLKLTATETATLLLILRALIGMPDVADPAVVRSAEQKLRAVAPRAFQRFSVLLDLDSQQRSPLEVATTVRRAVDSRRVLEIDYWSGSDERSTRQVNPVQLRAVDGFTYLYATDRVTDNGEQVKPKTFRLDRIESARVLDEAAARITSESPDPEDPHGFLAEDEAEWVPVRIADGWTWVSEYDPVVDIEPAEDGDGYTAWIPEGDIRRTAGFLLKRFPGVRATDDGAVARTVVSRAEMALAAYAQLPASDDGA
ncbi:WYL domain-containing protein [Corynebacterium sp. TAE3-ERU12]|uniref:helix-turn-helix transcriptional regulator n=1 Tax=Corynebacterium sp. TAE3-ERU12 TaxID=2849491 RepID=UPI001C47A1CB|nr:WYL domain-containing protein [Corynebacterium sp. TAE3-ERU12]MBV7295472.1 WYL domain-containing protein [Corynebacterium sp. TAE3-ERU12]